MSFQASVEPVLREKLLKGLSPSHLEVINESHKHSVPENSETHFQVTLVCASFEGLTLVKRHQMVYRLLQQELSGGVHALALHTYTRAEWDTKLCAPNSPACLGGSAKEKS